MIDLHMHSYFSMDSTEKLENIIKTSMEMNIDTIALTDHFDLYLKPNANSFSFDLDKYFKTLNEYKKIYADKLEILIGIEIGLQPDMCEINDEILNSHDFDFSIGSIHTVKHMDIYLDKYLDRFSPLDALKYYYDDMLFCVQNTKNFNILGHIDYIDRYFENKSMIPDFHHFSQVIEEILLEIISSHKGIELNTAGIRKGLDYMNPKDEILKLYKKLGGNIITIGSDAHFAKDIGANYTEAENILKKIGFKHLNKFVNKKNVSINFSGENS